MMESKKSRQDPDREIFERTYPKYEFSELVRLSVGLAAIWRGLGRRPRSRETSRRVSARLARPERFYSWPRFGKQIF